MAAILGTTGCTIDLSIGDDDAERDATRTTTVTITPEGTTADDDETAPGASSPTSTESRGSTSTATDTTTPTPTEAPTETPTPTETATPTSTPTPTATPNDRYEPNDDFASATGLSSDTYLDLQIAAGESDYFAFDLNRGQQVDVRIEFSHDQGDLDLTVYDTDRNELDDSLSVNDDEHVRVPTEQTGTHFIEVHGHQNASAPYDLSLEAGWDDANEPDDDFQDATLIAPGEYPDRQLNDGESDFYATSADRGDTLSASITFSHALGDLDLTVYDPNRNEVDTSTSVDDNESVEVDVTDTGTYFIEVQGFDGASAPYDLSVGLQ